MWNIENSKNTKWKVKKKIDLRQRLQADAKNVQSMKHFAAILFFVVYLLKWNEIKTSIAPKSSEGRAQRRNPALSNSKEESREISMVVIRDPGRRGARAEKPDWRNAF